jgi:hypothetical protein
MTLNNIDFNKISYEDGLALVKKAEEQRGMAKVAEGGGEGDGGGIVEAIKTFIKENPELLKHIGIGAAGGGTLGLLSSLTESPRSRRPLRRGLIGALLGAAGGGAYTMLPAMQTKKEEIDKMRELKTETDKLIEQTGDPDVVRQKFEELGIDPEPFLGPRPVDPKKIPEDVINDPAVVVPKPPETDPTLPWRIAGVVGGAGAGAAAAGPLTRPSTRQLAAFHPDNPLYAAMQQDPVLREAGARVQQHGLGIRRPSRWRWQQRAIPGSRRLHGIPWTVPIPTEIRSPAIVADRARLRTRARGTHSPTSRARRVGGTAGALGSLLVLFPELIELGKHGYKGLSDWWSPPPGVTDYRPARDLSEQLQKIRSKK